MLPLLTRPPARPLLPLRTPLISGIGRFFNIAHASPPSRLRADVTEKSCQLWGFPTAVRSLSSGWKSAVSMAASARSHPLTLPSSSSSQTSFLRRVIHFQIDRCLLEELKHWRKKGMDWIQNQQEEEKQRFTTTPQCWTGLDCQSLTCSKSPF